MKPVMYHYVRQARPDLPHLPYLDVANFRRQRDYFEATYGIVDRDSFESWLEGGDAPAGVVLTFDDGLRDHIDIVLPVIKERGLFALFYACSLPILTERILDVHKVHLAASPLAAMELTPVRGRSCSVNRATVLDRVARWAQADRHNAARSQHSRVRRRHRDPSQAADR